MSNFIPVTNEVPHGGVLSSILFSLYINDLPDANEFSSILLYAGDIKIFPILDQSIVENLQSNINSLSTWCNKWRLINVSTYIKAIGKNTTQL